MAQGSPAWAVAEGTQAQVQKRSEGGEAMIYKRGKLGIYWYKFSWQGRMIYETTRQRNPRVARQMEAAHKTALAKGEVGIRDRQPTPTLAEFLRADFLPHVRSHFAAKPKTISYYEYGAKGIAAWQELAGARLDEITAEHLAVFTRHLQARALAIASVNRHLQVLRRAFRLASEWGKTAKALPVVRMLPGERHRDRVISRDEEKCYLAVAATLLHDVTILLRDFGLRPEECFRLRWENVGPDYVQVYRGKTDAAGRRLPFILSARAKGVLDMRRAAAASDWVFAAPTKSGHAEPSSIRKQHLQALSKSRVQPFAIYCWRHTCLTDWGRYMDPWTFMRLAGHGSMAITMRYVHPQDATILAAARRAGEACEKALGGDNFGDRQEIASAAAARKSDAIH